MVHGEKTHLLQVKRLRKEFGGIVAVKDVSFDVHDGEIVALIGPNGAGKSTTFNLVSAVYPPTGGEIYYRNQVIHGQPSYVAAQMGISRTFQNLQIFTNMTVEENVMMGQHTLTRAGLLDSALRLPWVLKEEREHREKALEVLDFVGLAKERDQGAGNLPLGKLRLLELARALASEPELLLLDEIAAGLNHSETMVMGELIEKIRQKGTAILLVEHDMTLVMGISDRVIVMDQGEKIAEGTPTEIQQNKRVLAAYLGDEEDFESLEDSA